MNTNVHVLGERDRPPWTEEPDHGRRQLLLLLSAVAGTSVLQPPYSECSRGANRDAAASTCPDRS